MVIPAPIITDESLLRIVRPGDSVGIEDVRLERSGPGVAVWRFNTDCKRTLVSIGGSARCETIIIGPQEGEPEWRPLEMTVPEDFGVMELTLPQRERMDHWIVTDLYDKHGGYIVAFLSYGVADFMDEDQIKQLQGVSDE